MHDLVVVTWETRNRPHEGVHAVPSCDGHLCTMTFKIEHRERSSALAAIYKVLSNDPDAVICGVQVL